MGKLLHESATHGLHWLYAVTENPWTNLLCFRPSLPLLRVLAPTIPISTSLYFPPLREVENFVDAFLKIPDVSFSAFPKR